MAGAAPHLSKDAEQVIFKLLDENCPKEAIMKRVRGLTDSTFKRKKNKWKKLRGKA